MVAIKTTISLIRHARTAWNDEQRIQGWMDTPLSKEGKREARRIGEHFVGKPLHAIYSSPFKRAIETAQEIARHHDLPIKREPAFREIRFGQFEGLRFEEIDRHPHYVHGLQRHGHFKYRPRGGESYHDLFTRVTPRFDVIVRRHPNEHIIFVVHGGVIRCLALHFKLITEDDIRRLMIPNAHPFSLVYDHQRENYTPIDFPLRL